jgi:hypothetical protein
VLKSLVHRKAYANDVRSLAVIPSDGSAPLDDRDLVRLLGAMPKLERLTWSAARLPPSRLSRALASMPRLKTFTLALASVPSAETLRIDGRLCDALPSGLASLHLSDLSQLGIRALGLSLPRLTALARLCLEGSRFVDDALLATIAACPCTSLSIVRMDGTKVHVAVSRFVARLNDRAQINDRGIVDLLDSPYLKRLELDDVQGACSVVGRRVS